MTLECIEARQKVGRWTMAIHLRISMDGMPNDLRHMWDEIQNRIYTRTRRASGVK